MSPDRCSGGDEPCFGHRGPSAPRHGICVNFLRPARHPARGSTGNASSVHDAKGYRTHERSSSYASLPPAAGTRSRAPAVPLASTAQDRADRRHGAGRVRPARLLRRTADHQEPIADAADRPARPPGEHRRRCTSNPFTLRLQLDRLHIAERDGNAPFVDVDRMVVNASWISLFRMAPVLDELALQHPQLHLARTAPQQFNFSDLIEKFAGQPAKPGSSAGALRAVQYQRARRRHRVRRCGDARQSPHRPSRTGHPVHRQPAARHRCVRAAAAGDERGRQPVAHRGPDQAVRGQPRVGDGLHARPPRLAPLSRLRAGAAAGGDPERPAVRPAGAAFRAGQGRAASATGRTAATGRFRAGQP